ncbi:MAG: hypothetical protein ACYC0J_02030 [Gammaproteobacteria bacterium]
MQSNRGFTVISNKGLGIAGSSLETIGEVSPSRVVGAAGIKSYINLANGNLILLDHHVRCMESNFPIELGYIYNSQGHLDQKNLWQLTLRKFKQMPKPPEHEPFLPAILIEEDGHETTYQYDGVQYWNGPSTTNTSPFLKYDPVQKIWMLTDRKTLLSEYYNQDGYLLRKENGRGEITEYEYDKKSHPWKLIKIISPSKTVYEINYLLLNDGMTKTEFLVNGKVQQANIFDQLGRLKKTIIPMKMLDSESKDDYVIDYSYSEDTHFLTGVNQSDHAHIGLQYDLYENKITRFYFGDYPEKLSNGAARIIYPEKWHPEVRIVNTDTRSIDEIYIDSESRITAVQRAQDMYDIDDAEDEKTTYAYPDNNTIVITEKGKESSPKKITRGSYLPGKSYEMSRWDGSNGQIKVHYYDFKYSGHLTVGSEVRYLDDKALPTFFTYDYEHGPNKNKTYLRFKISSEGRVTEFRPHPDKVGAWTKITYLNFYENVMERPLYSSPTVHVMEKWAASQDYTTMSMVDYENDIHGQLSSTIEYTDIGKDKKGVINYSTGKAITGHDIHGNLTSSAFLQTPDQEMLTTSYEFDKLKRLQLLTDSAGIKTIYSDDVGIKSIVYPSGREVIQHVDVNDKLLCEEEKASINGEIQVCSTIHQWTLACMETVYHPDGSQTFHFKDAQHRPKYDISPTGRVVKEINDSVKRYKVKIQFANRIDVSILHADVNGKPYPKDEDPLQNPSDSQLKLALENGKLIDTDSKNRCSYEFFDESGRLRYTVDADNYVIETKYDTLNRPVATIAYVKSISNDILEKLKNGEHVNLEIDAQKDRCTRHFYDADGLKIGIQDPEGYVTEFKRNGAGWITHKICYVTNQSIQFNMVNFEDIRPVSHSKDIVSQYIHNSRGLVKYEIDAKGYLTYNTYTASGKISSSRRYANKLQVEWLANPVGIPPIPEATTEDYFIVHEYDQLDREKLTIDADGITAKTGYDVMGHVITQEERDAFIMGDINGDVYRAKQVTYDAWDQLVSEANPFVAEKLALVDANSAMSDADKMLAKKSILDKLSKKHTYNEVGL